MLEQSLYDAVKSHPKLPYVEPKPNTDNLHRSLNESMKKHSQSSRTLDITLRRGILNLN